MFVKKRPKKKVKMNEAAADAEEMAVESIFTTYNIIIMVGTHRIENRKLTSSGKLQREFKLIEPPGRIIRF